jgi:hypothetical protein
MRILRQNTDATLHVGPCVDEVNGYVPITTLVATGGGAVDELSLYKGDATAAVDIRATTTLTHRAGGTYTFTLAAGDTNTLGRLRVTLRDDDQIRPIAMDFMVVPANVFDSLAGSDLLQVDPREVAGIAAAATNLARGAEGLVIGTVLAGATTTSVPTDLSSAVNDNFKGRVVTFVDGPLAGQSTAISAYDGSSKTLTVVALTSAPANGNRIVIS